MTIRILFNNGMEHNYTEVNEITYTEDTVIIAYWDYYYNDCYTAPYSILLQDEYHTCNIKEIIEIE